MANTYEAELLRSARALARLQSQRRKLKRQLRAVEVDIKAERRTLKALAAQDRDPDVIPSRLFGDGVGRKVGPVERVADETPVEALDLEPLPTLATWDRETGGRCSCAAFALGGACAHTRAAEDLAKVRGSVSATYRETKGGAR